MNLIDTLLRGRERVARGYYKFSTGWIRKVPKVRGKAAVKAAKRARQTTRRAAERKRAA